jgi:hypothetical protein
VTSEPGKGANFRVFLPAGDSTDTSEYADGKKEQAR